ncbi:MAG: UvrD-helicase domain-containing protein, partial [Clostridia bacterium]|nr:UvrD-helicase domain-containing protein [Clostridia bacterium]
MSRKFTTEQTWAIEAHGGTILVSAAAGSGKTTVLIERVMRMLTREEKPVSADRLLIVTFTKAAAAEMRSRLGRALTERLEAQPDNQLLRHQKLLLQRARIDTIHSFCAATLREFFAPAGIAPDFRIAETAELKLLKNEILHEIIEQGYTDADEPFLALCELCGDERGEGSLESVILQIDGFVTAFPDPDEKLSELAAMYRGEVSFADTPWAVFLRDYAKEYIAYTIRLCESAIGELSSYGELDSIYRTAFEDDLACLRALYDTAIGGDWDDLYYALRSISLPRLPIVRGEVEGKERIQGLRKKIKEICEKKLPDLLPVTGAEFGGDMARLSPIVERLCGMVQSLREQFASRKAERKMLDYDDLEHLTARLLFCREDDKFMRTAIAKEMSGRFDEILIDEYQDTNYTQDLIFRAISREEGDVIGEGENMFMVGDIKQSIYGFRKAVPKLFLDRFNRYTPYDPAAPRFPARITLGANFRSRREVTEGVNYIFAQLMTPQRGGIEYNDDQRLQGRREFPEGGDMSCELHLLDGSIYDDESGRDITEARYCADIISRMVAQGFLVTDRSAQGELRPARYSDFCIMRRSVKGAHGDAFVSELTNAGIPVSLSVDKGFFSAPEINVIMSLLRAVDNPLLDISLAAALRSPIFGFDCDMLARLRERGQRQSLYANLSQIAQEGDASAAEVMELLRVLRAMAATMPSDRLIAAVYRRTGYLAAVQAMKGGEAR